MKYFHETAVGLSSSPAYTYQRKSLPSVLHNWDYCCCTHNLDLNAPMNPSVTEGVLVGTRT